MTLLVATVLGVDEDIVSKILESSERCKRGNKNYEYRNLLDAHSIRSKRKDPIVFDIIAENHSVSQKSFLDITTLVIPCRPDLIWEKLKEKYKNPESAFCNRMRRLKEIAKQNKSIVLPYESLGTIGGFKSLQLFLGVSKGFLTCGWEEPQNPIDCPMITRYNKDIKKMSTLPSWYQKYTF